jgi:hypothetical protein
MNAMSPALAHRSTVVKLHLNGREVEALRHEP